MLRQKVVFIEWVPIDSNCIEHCQDIYINHFISYKKIIPLVNSQVLNFTVEFERFIPYGIKVSIIYRVTTTKRKGQGIELIPCHNDLKKY